MILIWLGKRLATHYMETRRLRQTFANWLITNETTLNSIDFAQKARVQSNLVLQFLDEQLRLRNGTRTEDAGWGQGTMGGYDYTFDKC